MRFVPRDAVQLVGVRTPEQTLAYLQYFAASSARFQAARLQNVYTLQVTGCLCCCSGSESQVKPEQSPTVSNAWPSWSVQASCAAVGLKGRSPLATPCPRACCLAAGWLRLPKHQLVRKPPQCGHPCHDCRPAGRVCAPHPAQLGRLSQQSGRPRPCRSSHC